ncbi:MAG: transglycosylase SLT domain-containing protein [Myxococcota bacterium]
MRCVTVTAFALLTGLLSAPGAQAQDRLLTRVAGPPSPLEVGVTPPALTSEAPPPRPEVARGEADLGWLQDLRMPDIPVRWDARVVDYLEHFRDSPRGRRSIGAWLRRARVYGPMIRAKLRALGLPEDLMYVAMVESGFDPKARSGAAAVGLWQFVERTGAQYGLDATHWVDERMDPEQATEAAGRYLRDLHERFGTWELALAAYNMGYGALLRSIRKYNTNDYWLLSHLEAGLPYETTLYVAKVMACAIVGANPERFGVEDAAQAEPVHTEVARVPGGMPLHLLARAAGVSTEELEALNPQLLRGRTPPGDAPYALRLPAEAADGFHARWAKIRPRHPAHRRYVMRFGETLDEVARRFRTSSAELRRLNGLENDADAGPGVELLVPAVDSRDRPSDEAAEDGEPPVVALPDAHFIYPDRRRIFYRTSGHDTLEDVAAFFQVGVEELRRWNAIDPGAMLHPGMILQLFVPPDVDLSQAVVLSEDDVRVLTVGSQEFFDYHESKKDRVRFRYTVGPDDTLQSIAERFGLAIGDLMRINRFGRSTVLEVGQEIVVYAPPEKVPPDLRASASR